MASAGVSLVGVPIRSILDSAPCTLYRIDEREPIISAGLHLSQLDVEGVVATDEAGKATGVILGYNVLRLLNPKTIWSTFYQTTIANSKMRVLLTRPEDAVQTIAKNILNHGWGYAIVVDPKGAPTNLIGLLDIAEFLLKSGFTARVANVRAREKASNPLLKISEQLSLMETIQTMLDKHVRRLFLRESDRIVSDRAIIKWLLSPANLSKLRDSPKEVLDSPLNSIGPVLHKPAFVEPSLDAASALQLILKGEARCLVTKDKSMILTPWDLTISLLAK